MVGMTDSALAASRGCDCDNWVDRRLGSGGQSPDVPVDPFAWLLSSAAAFLIEHLRPFREILDSLDVDPAAIDSYIQDWDGISGSLTDSRRTLVHAVTNDTSSWHGAAADAYRRKAEERADAIGAAAVVAGAIGTVVVTMSKVVEFVRDEIRRLITELVRMLISWVEEAVFSFGLALPFVAAQAITAIADWAPKINDQLSGLTGTIRRVESALGRLTGVFTEIIERLGASPDPSPITLAQPAVIRYPNPEPQIDEPVGAQDTPNQPGSPARHVGESLPAHTPPADDRPPTSAPWPYPAGPGPSWSSTGTVAGDSTAPSAAGPAGAPSTRVTQPFESRSPDGQPSYDPNQARPSNTELPFGGGGAAPGQPGRGGATGGLSAGRRTFGGWTGTPGGLAAAPPPDDEPRGHRAPRPAAAAPSRPESSRTVPQSDSGTRGGHGRRGFGGQTDDELYEFIGAFLRGQGTDGSPADRDRSRRVGHTWLDKEKARLWRQIHDSDTYRAWLDSAGTGQVIDQDTLTEILRQQGAASDPAAALAELLVRTEVAMVTQEYDIAVSFASEQRDYVEQVVTAAKALGLLVFYDQDLSNTWWGRNFVLEQRKIYGQLALHFVPFISTEYLAKPYPLDEFSYAMIRAIDRGNRYILPILIGSVVVPPELLHPHIGYLRAEDHTPDQLAAHMKLTVENSRAAGHRPRDVGTLVHDAHQPDSGS